MNSELNIKIITGSELRKMQLLQLDMILELDRVCRVHDIPYILIGGSLLGAVRHHGYIPWDDDADIAMLREDYERFKTVCDEMNSSICWFQDFTTDSEYRWGYGKLRRTGTTYIRAGQEHLKCQTGVCVDVFPLDDIPRSIIGQGIQDFVCYCLRKILWSEVARVQYTGLKKAWFTLLSKIPIRTVYKVLHVYTRKSHNDTAHKVRILLFPSIGKLYRKAELPLRFGFPKKWVQERSEYEFEGHKLYGTKDYDAFLSYEYGDYMKLPPESDRESHAPVSAYSF